MIFFSMVRNLLFSTAAIDEEQKRIAVIIKIISVFAFLGTSFLILLHLILQDFEHLLIFSTLDLLLFFSLLLIRKNYYEYAGSLVVWAISFFFFYMAFTHDGINDTALIGIPSLMILAGLIFNKTEYIIFSLIAIMSILMLGIMQITGILNTQFNATIKYIDIFDTMLILCISAMVIRILTDTLLRSLKKAWQKEKEIQKQSEELKLSEEKYRTIVESANEGIMFFDINSRVTFCNARSEELIGYTAGELKNLNLEMLLFGEDIPDHRERMESRRRGIKDTIERRFRKKDGSTLWTILSSSPLFDNGSFVGFYAMISDITRRKLAEIEMQKAKEEAERMSQLKSHFLTQISHEIRTPVNTITNFISLLKTEFDNNMSESQEMCLNMITSGSRRLIRTIDMILIMSQFQTSTYDAKFKILNIYEDILNKLYQKFLAEAGNLDFTISNTANRLDIVADPYSIYHLFGNLIDNAVKYTETGYVKILIYENSDGRLCVDIADSGIGISEDYRQNIFNAFSQEETGYTRRFEGNGLGLALVQKYAELNKVKISVQTCKDEGTIFTVVMPAAYKMNNLSIN